MPELLQLQQELADSMSSMQGKLEPVLAKVQKTLNRQLRGDEAVVTKHGMSYLEMKYNLMLSYVILLSFYMLLKLSGKEVSSHPVVKRLIHHKLLLEKLRPLDQKLTYQVEKLVRQAVLGEVEGDPNQDDQRLAHRPNVEMLQ